LTASGLGEGVNEPMTKVSRPPSKGGNFLHGDDLPGKDYSKHRVKVLDVRPDQKLRSGLATVLDLQVGKEKMGLALNVTNHKAICELFGDPKADGGEGSFDTKDVIGKTISLIKVPGINNPQKGTVTHGVRIATPGGE